jgi:hypothetical protein
MKRVVCLFCFAVSAFPLSLTAQISQIAQITQITQITWSGPDSSPYAFTTSPSLEPMEGGGAGQVVPAGYGERPFTKIAIGGGVGLLGTGGEVAINLPFRLDARAFGNYLNYTYSFPKNDFNVAVNADMANSGVMVDYYPWKALRISPGYMLYNSDRIRGDVLAGRGATFTINNVDYGSDDADPVYAIGRLVLAGRGFMVTTGWGHIVSRSSKHWSFPFEAGVAFIDTPRVFFDIYGKICSDTGTNCASPTAYPGFENNLQAQLSSWNNQVSPFHIYPVIRGGVAYTFRIRH